MVAFGAVGGPVAVGASFRHRPFSAVAQGGVDAATSSVLYTEAVDGGQQDVGGGIKPTLREEIPGRDGTHIPGCPTHSLPLLTLPNQGSPMRLLPCVLPVLPAHQLAACAHHHQAGNMIRN